MPYRTYELCGFAPKTWVPRFSDGISENSAVSLLEIWPTNKMYLFFQKSQWASLRFFITLAGADEVGSGQGAGGLGCLQGN